MWNRLSLCRSLAFARRQSRVVGGNTALRPSGSTAAQLPRSRAFLHNLHNDSEDGREVEFGSGVGVSFGSVGAPGIVVVGSKWGLEDQVQLHAERLATYGFHCLAPDLYHGALPGDGIDGDDSEANAMANALNWPAAAADVRAAAEHLRLLGSPAVGVVGFGLGAALALSLVVNEKEEGPQAEEGEAETAPVVDCVSLFYGGAPPPGTGLPELSSPVPVPVQAHFGMKDQGDPSALSTSADADALQAVLEEEGIAGGRGEAAKERMRRAEHRGRHQRLRVQFYRYADVGHSFMEDSEESARRLAALALDPPHEQSVEDAWARLAAFMSLHLK